MPRCTEPSCGRWRPERLAPRWAAGIRFNGDWFCSRACVEEAVRAGLDASGPRTGMVAPMPPLRLGALLRHMGAITEDQLQAALAAQRASGLRLGAQLQRLGAATREQVVRALATQANVSYLTSIVPSRIPPGPAWLPADTVRALGLVPFAVDSKLRRIRVLCSAPVPKSAVRALATLTGWAPDVYLVDDEIWNAAMHAYRTDEDDRSSHDVVRVNGIDAAAAFVAETALTDRAVTMRHASCGSYTWVRLERPAQVSDLLLAGDMEETCRAAHTAH